MGDNDEIENCPVGSCEKCGKDLHIEDDPVYCEACNTTCLWCHQVRRFCTCQERWNASMGLPY